MSEEARGSADESGARNAVEKYIAGVHKSDVEVLREAFRSDAHMWGILAGAPFAAPVGKFFELVASDPPPGALPLDLTPTGQWEDSYGAEITAIQVNGNVATAVLEEQGYRGANFVTYFSLLREDGEWRIAGKLFTTT